MPPKAGTWYVYVVECEGGFLYTGISNDPEKRFEKHRAGKGAAFMRLHKAIRLLSVERAGDYGLALRREAQLKSLSREGKDAYLKSPERVKFPGLKDPWFHSARKKRKIQVS